ncbi:hypothetical protein AWM75_08500 [Aerococcus urinaehominis]|uniref:Uncharacterized protein n=1 Tax=Aerococcus urinaehominis TaxID=128944 RepID=A0A0X8FMG6_9LACT|nr:LacI family DNA-binding transcriptional regulator [Aerococcus urinaehominis]AMC00009.1 hypothetical protein AWM75_08500 [Aerococcus urinaehominis]SDL82061.1 transcriptional regulator, LacI family [Aerococcus urinaehominis]
MAVTIKDVAEKAGVAPSTVSRVLTNNPAISEKTRQKVQAVMAELNYVPNYNARRLASQHSQTIGLVLPLASDAFYQNPFFPTILRGINEAAAQEDYVLLLSAGDSADQQKAHLENMVYGKQVAGLIFLYASADDPLLAMARQANFPSVVVGTPDTGQVNAIDNDNFDLGYQAGRYLLSQGCQKLAYIGGDSQQFFIQQREAGFLKSLSDQADIIGDSYNAVNFLPNDGYQLIMDLYHQGQTYDGYVVADELVARGVVSALQATGQDQVKTIDFRSFASEDSGQDLYHPYFNLNIQTLGRRAVTILFEQLNSSEEASGRYIYEVVASDLVGA